MSHPQAMRNNLLRKNCQQHLLSMDFKSAFSVGLMDNRHVWIRFTAEDDYLRLYSRPVWYIGGKAMRMFKWTPYFRVDIESSLVPVWVNFPRLPIQFFHKAALFPIASLIGLPLRPDAATISLKRPSVARIQIELDLLKPRPDKIWITVGSGGGCWQDVEYEAVPPYCSHCMHVGHSEQSCTVHNPNLAPGEEKRLGQWIPKSQDNPKSLIASETVVNFENKVDSRHKAQPRQLGAETSVKSTYADLSESPDYDTERPLLPVIFCGDASDSEDDGEIIVDCSTHPHNTNLMVESLVPASAPLAWSPEVVFPKPKIFFGDDTPQSSQDFSDLSFLSSDRPGQQLNVDATPWHPHNRGKSTLAAPSQTGHTLPQTFNQSYNFDAPDDDYSSWRTVDSADEDAQEDDDGEDFMEDFLDSQYTRDDLYMEKRKNRQAFRERDMVQMRRGRGRPLGSRNSTFLDVAHPVRQSGRNNKGIPPKHFESGL